MAPKSLKLIYFNGRGRAELSRLILAVAGQKYEDVRIVGENWPAEKSKTPFGQLPVLEVDGQTFGQSLAIATYLAREFNLYGKTNLDGLKIDQVVQLCVDFQNSASKVFFEKDENKKAEGLKNLREVEVPKYLGFFEKLLKENGSGYFVGSSLTLAELYVYDLLFNFQQRSIVKLDDFHLLNTLYKKVDNQDKIKAYVSKRPFTEF
ncbi:probable glutathione S-transferase 6 [Biomphalaria glabrata]|uniref:Probable glutathione S-transferase 6 n=1 Tax=Biomphalaria glabrata TaxID=6526 RepID=A0A9W3A7M0_BIOGL|nr:probable glutathione S-transferase 6 [Biomphalaria glabrata]XP_055883169.1 probable glutathione S-transferase 6 [Biomphalaria glabrata]